MAFTPADENIRNIKQFQSKDKIESKCAEIDDYSKGESIAWSGEIDKDGWMVHDPSAAEKIQKKQYIPPVRATDEDMVLLKSIHVVKA